MDWLIFKINLISVTRKNEQNSMPLSLSLLSLSLLSSSLPSSSSSTTTTTTKINKNGNGNKIIILFLLLIVQSTIVECLICYDGADCLQSNTCNKCSGIGCIRMKSYNTEHIHTIALTCLPYATRIYQLEPAGCRISLAGDSEQCICYDSDYCNHATGSSLFHFNLISFIIPVVFVTISLYILQS